MKKYIPHLFACFSLLGISGIASSNYGFVQNIAKGHHQLRKSIELLNQRNGGGGVFTSQSFNSPSVNQLRSFMANSQVVTQVSTEYYSGTTVYTFCADGTFQYYHGSLLSVDTQSPSGGRYDSPNLTSIDKSNAQGYWDAYNENGNNAILIYSADPRFASESINNTGLLAMPIAQYQSDLVQIGQRGQPGTVENLVRRHKIAGC